MAHNNVCQEFWKYKTIIALQLKLWGTHCMKRLENTRRYISIARLNPALEVNPAVLLRESFRFVYHASDVYHFINGNICDYLVMHCFLVITCNNSFVHQIELPDSLVFVHTRTSII